ncbi:hypothetical protein CEXT_716121, partial [Caerostris extrusa]
PSSFKAKPVVGGAAIWESIASFTARQEMHQECCKVICAP